MEGGHEIEGTTMITKITKLHGVGTLHAPLACGALIFKNKVILYGENGRGKTTLVALIRSLMTGDGSALRRRKSIKGVHPQIAQFLINQTPHDLNNGQWSKPHPHIAIFDATFINENIYTGDFVEADHRKNLLNFALGEEGVALAHRVDSLAADISAQRKTEAEAKALIQPYLKGNITAEVFLKLSSVDGDIEAQLAEKRRTHDALMRASILQNLQMLSPISFDDISISNAQAIFERTVESISRDAKAKLKEHLQAAHATEEWIAQGKSFDSGRRCPYCAQDLRESDVAETYNTYFSDTYRKYRAALISDLEKLEEVYSKEKQMAIRAITDGNRSRLLQWKEFLPEAVLDFDINSVLQIIEEARIALQAAVRRKLADPLEEIKLNPEEAVTIDAVGAAVIFIDDYNAAEVKINRLMQELRNAVQAGNLMQAEAEVIALENRIARHSVKGAAACAAWVDATRKRESLEEEKKAAREKLDDYTSSNLQKYKDAINVHLKACGTSFKISTLKTTYIAGNPRCEYGIELFGEAVDLASKPTSTITFDSALSMGDKNALAFAFFLARIESDSKCGEKILIFDDPLSSLDSVRRSYTRKKLAELSGKAAQIIVLTHEEATVAAITQQLGESDCTLFELKSQGEYSAFAPVTVKEITGSEYVKCFDSLNHYVYGEGKSEDVVKAIRPFLEMNLRYRFPDEFKADSLGKMLGQIRSAESNKPLAKLIPIYKDLEEINEFCTKHSHGDEVLTNSERLLASDLKAIVELSLDISKGFPSQSGR